MEAEASVCRHGSQIRIDVRSSKRYQVVLENMGIPSAVINGSYKMDGENMIIVPEGKSDIIVELL